MEKRKKDEEEEEERASMRGNREESARLERGERERIISTYQ
jgi:hypothetical protein